MLLPPASTFSGETLKIITVAVPAVSLLQAPLFVAMDAGAFRKHSMEVRYVVTGARTIQALVGGSVQFAQGVSSRTVPAAGLAGADAVLIANFSDKLLFTMHSAPEIHTLQDLKGKIVGVSGVGGVPEIVAALRAKAVQAGTLSPPSSFVAQKAGFKLLFDMASLGVDYVSSGLGVKKSYLAANRLEAKQFLMAMIEGAKLLTTNEEFALRTLAKHTRISDREVLQDSYAYLRPFFLKVPYPSRQAIQDTLDILARDQPKAKDADPRHFIDNSLVKELESNRYIETVYGK